VQPKAAAIMLTNGSRPGMLNRAVRCFRSQTYANKVLIVLNSGPDPFISPTEGVQITWSPGLRRSIGELRNLANKLAVDDGAEILLHMDDDDWSGPGRIQEQVNLLYSTGADVVGYHEMLFWNTWLSAGIGKESEALTGGAWLFSSPNPNACLGTSLLYRASAWKETPFPARNTAEDHLWCLKQKKISAVSAGVHAPRMIASVHGDNTCSKITPGAREWTRVKQSDNTCRRLMEL
jgi:hypothetical protein